MKPLFLALLVLLPFPVGAHEFLLDDFQIIHPAVPATPLDSTTAHIYMALVNDGTEPERLLRIETAYGPATLERFTTAADGSVRIEKMAWIDIPPGEIVLMAPGELRGRVEGIAQPLLEGGELNGAFIFEKRGRFDMFFLVDPVEEVEETPSAAAPASIDRAAETVAIAGALRSIVGEAAVIAPIAVVDDVGIAGWTIGEQGARAFVRKRDGEWQVLMWSGPSLLLQATMNSLGVSRATADRLRAELRAGSPVWGQPTPPVSTIFPAPSF